MSVQTETSVVEYAGNGSTTEFPVTFAFLNSAHLVVTLTEDDIEDVLEEGVDYTVAGSTLTATVAPASGATLTITREVPYTQPTVFRAQGSFSPGLHENAIDLAVMQAQQLDRRATGLEDRVSEVEPRVDTLEDETDDLDGRATSLESRATTLEGRADDLEAEDVALAAAITAGDASVLAQSAAAVASLLETIGPGGATSTSTVIASGAITPRTLANRFGEIVNVKDFGATGDGTTDDTVAITAAVTQTVALGAVKPVLWFPPATGYACATVISVPAGICVVMDAPILHTGTANATALLIGTQGADNSYIRHQIRVKRVTQSDWTSESAIGVKFWSPVGSNIDIVHVEGFTIGVQLMGSGRGVAYNKVDFQFLYNNRIAVDLTNETFNANPGWANENIFTNGRFAVQSALHTLLTRWGFRITSADGTYNNNNNNVWHKPSLELNHATLSTGFLFVHGVQNYAHSVRSEGTAVVAEFQNATAQNFVDTGFPHTSTLRVDTSSFGSNMVVAGERRHMARMSRLVFDSGPLAELVTPYDATNFMIPGMGIYLTGGTSVSRVATSLVMATDYLEVPGSRAICVKIDTVDAKEFVVERSVVSGFGGRLKVQCLDAAGAVLTSAGGNHPYIRSSNSLSLTYAASFGGHYGQGNDSPNAMYFRVHDDVKAVIVMVTGGTAALRIKGMRVFSSEDLIIGGLAVTAGYSGRTEMRRVATQAPASGTWEVGAQVWDATPVSATPMGWVCSVAGTPGTWVNMPNFA